MQMEVSAGHVLGLPVDVYVSGVIFHNDSFFFSATASLAKSGSKNIYDPVFGAYICRAQYSLSGDFLGIVSGTANSLSVSAVLVASAWGKCGAISGSIGVEFSLAYVSPATFSGKAKVLVDYGAGTWKPTVFTFQT